MRVRLLSKTTGLPGTEYENKSIDEIIVGIARISSSRETNELFNEPDKLLRHCIKNGHWSIFDQANLTFEIVTSRAIGREYLRHWSLHPQEYSQRYASAVETEKIELRFQSKKNRQSSTEVCTDEDLNKEVEQFVEYSQSLYNKLLSKGISRETARFVLPETTTTKLTFNGTVRQWITLLNQRLHMTAQKEAVQIAEKIRDIFIQECPVISKVFDNFANSYDHHVLDLVILDKYNVDLTKM